MVTQDTCSLATSSDWKAAGLNDPHLSSICSQMRALTPPIGDIGPREGCL